MGNPVGHPCSLSVAGLFFCCRQSSEYNIVHCGDSGGGGGNGNGGGGGGGGGTSESLLTKTDSSGRCRPLCRVIK